MHSIKPQIISDNNIGSSSSPISWNSSSKSSAPTLISFENSENMDYKSNINLDQMGSDYSSTSEILQFSSSAKDDSGSNDEYYPDMNQKRINSSAANSRTPSQALDHVMAERKRRENLSQLFISLSKVVPGLKKLDKASLLEDGITYLKDLQERVRVLEEEEERRSISSVDAAVEREGSSSDGPEIRARISEKHVLIKIFCKKEMGLMSRIPCEMLEKKMHLNVVDMRLMPFGGTSLDITILAEMQGEFEGTVKDIVDHLHTLFL
ncbi:hypothetical protein C2S51_036331 [Perilla frutescens var. frutescens]|nr:hypothetical protein C2S51_036331 [Perilla frutescens var. frutescens]